MPVPDHDIDAIDAILRDWLADADITIICGRWDHGGIMELLPDGNARLSGPRYEGDFAGLRDIELAGQPHHLHIDLARLTRVVYTIAPSVCYGFRPAFEVRLGSEVGGQEQPVGLALALRGPYTGRELHRAGVRRYLRRLAGHQRAYPGIVHVRALDGPVPAAAAARRDHDWAAIGACLEEEFDVATQVTDARSFETAVGQLWGRLS